MDLDEIVYKFSVQKKEYELKLQLISDLEK